MVRSYCTLSELARASRSRISIFVNLMISEKSCRLGKTCTLGKKPAEVIERCFSRVRMLVRWFTGRVSSYRISTWWLTKWSMLSSCISTPIALLVLSVVETNASFPVRSFVLFNKDAYFGCGFNMDSWRHFWSRHHELARTLLLRSSLLEMVCNSISI